MLSQRGCSHLVLERNRIAERWRSERWDEMRFQFPNWSVRLPDFPFPHADPDGFATNGQIVDFITAYAAFVAAPIRCGVCVTALRRHDTGSAFVAETTEGMIEADNVPLVDDRRRPERCARRPQCRLLGFCAGPHRPGRGPGGRRHRSQSREQAGQQKANPGQLPPGAVLVVGSGASGAQITEELFRAGRRVYLSVGQHTRLPRRYRGRDLTWWLSAMGLDQTPTEMRGPDRSNPLITGAFGGDTIDFRRFAAEGVTLLGRMQAADHTMVTLAADLSKRLA